MPSATDQLRVLLAGMSDHEFHDALHLVNEEAERRRRFAALAFRVGDRVSFETRNGDRVSGVVERINARTISLREDDGTHWRVGPEFLRPEAAPVVAKGFHSR
ncbi:MAG TPA: mechanosensitive ion channel domain-containing protein [Candidatus Thermoplasmatota archaeon]